MSDDTTRPLEELLGENAETETAATLPYPATTAAAEPAAPTAAPAPRPRIRWASVIWGLIFIAGGWLSVWTLRAGSRRTAFTDWLVELRSTDWIVVGVLLLGGILLVSGVIAGLRRLSRPHRTATQD